MSPQNARNFFQKCMVPGSENFIDEDDKTLFVVLLILVLLLFSNVDLMTRNLDFCERENARDSIFE
jgi:hypothetical protein